MQGDLWYKVQLSIITSVFDELRVAWLVYPEKKMFTWKRFTFAYFLRNCSFQLPLFLGGKSWKEHPTNFSLFLVWCHTCTNPPLCLGRQMCMYQNYVEAWVRRWNEGIMIAFGRTKTNSVGHCLYCKNTNKYRLFCLNYNNATTNFILKTFLVVR